MRDWRKEAACKDYPTDWWFDLMPWRRGRPEKVEWKETIRKAKEICETCPVKQDCLDWALKHEDYGLWGGFTPGQRDRIRRTKNLRLVAPEVAVTISPCGTPAGYQAHRRKGEETCQPCRTAHTNNHTGNMAKRGWR